MIGLLINYFRFNSIKIRLKSGKISWFTYFDSKCRISTETKINRFCTLRNVSIDDYSFIGPNCSLFNVKIGKFCSISKNVNIGAPTHPTDRFSSSPIFYREINGTGTSWIKGQLIDDTSREIIIGNDVWVGFNVTIMGGVHIGDGAIIAAHSVVTKSVDAYSIVGGVPAREIKKRFDPVLIDSLNKLGLWSLSNITLKHIANYLSEKPSVEKINRLSQLINELKGKA